jgi:DNA-binding transcriptional ArsR family regulator
MLDMDLVRGRPALEVEFRTSLAADLLYAIALVMNAPSIEGVDQWVYATHAALPPTLKGDMEHVLTLTQKSEVLIQWINQLGPDDPAHRDFPAFIAWLNGLTEDDFQSLIESTLKGLAGYCEEEQVSPPSLEDIEELRACLGAKFDAEQVDRAVQLVRNPIELKAQFISVLTRFWEQFYRQEYQRCLSRMERSVEHHRRQNYSADLFTIFTAVTGRRFPKGRGGYEDVERVIFIPSCHIGPYVAIYPLKEPQLTLILHYNSRPTSAPEGNQVPVIQDLFPPIKALADETRLQILSILDGRELYAQEIVAQLDISQSAVSRHLKLMVAGGVLAVRKEDSMKYFSVNEETLAGLAERLKSFRGKSE